MLLMKKCRKCGIEKLIGEFDKGRKRKDGSYGVHSKCKSCVAKKNRTYRINHPEEHRERSRLFEERHKERLKKEHLENPRHRFITALRMDKAKSKRYGYIPCNATEEELKNSVTGKCHSCDKLEVDCDRRLSMDHNHKTGKFRGWLCTKCNTAAGMIEDSPELALALALYLERNRL